MKKNADQATRDQALNIHQSFIVQAPAGSGKTTLLTQRILALLAVVDQPEHVLALTFTKKAANEMQERIFSALHDISNVSAEAVLKRSEDRGWGLLSNPNRLKIQTFDALCAQITQQLPITSGLGGQTAIADDPRALYHKAAAQLCLQLDDSVPWQPALGRLLAHVDNQMDRLQSLFIQMLSNRDQWISLMLNKQKNQKAFLEKALKHLQDDCFLPCRTVLEPFFNALIQPLNFLHPTSPVRLKDFDELTFWQNRLLPLILTQKGEWRKTLTTKQGFPAANELKGEMKTQIKALKTDLLSTINDMAQYANPEELHELLELPESYYSESQWQVLSDLVELLPVCVAQLQTVFREEHLVDFNEINLRALAALGQINQPSDIALSYDYQIQHILVDEFQDTSLLQHQLLLKLTQGWETDDGRTLFFVGDPMQSIYRFRQAEVGLFLFVQRYGLGDIQLAPLTLTTNFRSSKTVLEWINTRFSQIFPKSADINLGSIPYSPVEAGQLHETIGCALKNTFTQAEDILNLIQELRRNYPDETVAVLARSRSHVSELCQLLTSSGTPFEAIDIDSLHARPVIRDLLALTKALLCPCDRIAWFSVLRSPMCGLLLSDLLAISDALPGQSCWPLPIPQILSPDSQQRLRYVIHQIKIAQADRYQIPLFAWVQSVFEKLHGPKCYPDEQSQEEIDMFGQLLAQFSWHEMGSFNVFEEKLKQLFAPSRAVKHLQIMTIHKAKGLEFDHVILPALEKQSPYDPHQLLHWLQRLRPGYPTDLILAPIDASDEEASNLYRYVRKQEQLKQYYENMRLLYVAATRAKKSLHGFLTLETEQKISKNALGYFLQEHVEKSETEQLNLSFDQDSSINKGISRLPISFFNLNVTEPHSTETA